MEVHIEVKVDKCSDGFQDDERRLFEHGSELPANTRAQIIAYAAAHLGSQFRTHVFSVFITGEFARIIRWDRAGAIVTEAFSYCVPDSYLVDFFRRYDASAPKERGMDDSVSFEPLELSEAARARQALNLASDASLLKFRVHEGDSVKYFIGNTRAFKGCASPMGRATRMFAVLDLEPDTVMCLKDTWRINHPGIDKEGDIYKSLQAEVSYIPDFICGDDIPGQRTCSQDFVSCTWARVQPKQLRHHQHDRFVLCEVARELTSFETSLELVTTMGDALQGQAFRCEKQKTRLNPTLTLAHKEAYEKARILHRDISSSNIMIDKDGRGLLINWDMSKHVDGEHANEACQSECTVRLSAEILTTCSIVIFM
jgi:hypothetical protein